MNSREIVKRAIHFQDPPRIPYNFDSNRTPIDGISYGEDMIWVFASSKEMAGDADEWGVVYQAMGESFGEPKVFPLEGAESLEGYSFPDYSEDWRYDEMRRQIEENGGEKYVLGMLPTGLFQRMIDLFGFVDFMTNVAAEPDLIRETCSKLCDIAIISARKMAECGIDGIITIDDTALQYSLMISMDSFREIFVPEFKRLYAECHKMGLDCFIHSCGYTLDIIEELIQAGCDVVNLDQQDNMGIQELSKRYRGRVCFYCPIDIQRTLDMGKEDIEKRVIEMVQAFATPHGGFIAKTYPQPKAVGMSNEYLKMMTDAFKACDYREIVKE